MSETAQEHRSQAPDSLRCAVITVSDTRTKQNDRGGPLVAELLKAAGHNVARQEIVPDEPAAIAPLLESLVENEGIQAILLTGGTGISARDRTYETVTRLITKALPGYGELFRTLSYAEIGAAAMLSRATGGVIEHTVVLTMPGSPAAVKLAMEKLILPELGHLVREATR